MHYVGIDWAQDKHQVAIVNAEGKCVSEFEVQQNGSGFALLQQQLAALIPVEVNLERPDGLLVDWLVQAGYAVFVTAPRAAASYRSRSSKDDRQDARLLANLRRTGQEECRPLVRHSDTVYQLLHLLRALEQLQRQQVRLTNQLRQVLQQYYPAMVHLFSDLHTAIALTFLQTYSTPAAAQTLSLSQLEAFLKQQHYNHMQRLPALYQTLHTPMPTAAVWQGYEQHVLALVPLIQALNQQLTALRRTIRTVFTSHPEAAWWQSSPRSGRADDSALVSAYWRQPRRLSRL